MRWDKPLNDEEGEISDLCREILSFLADNPAAQDTIEGIAEWWLLERDLRREIDKIHKALAHLVAESLVIEKRGPNGRSRFAMNIDRLADIKELIEGEPD